MHKKKTFFLLKKKKIFLYKKKVFFPYKKKIFFLYKKKNLFFYKKKIFFLYKKKIFFLYKKKIFLYKKKTFFLDENELNRIYTDNPKLKRRVPSAPSANHPISQREAEQLGGRFCLNSLAPPTALWKYSALIQNALALHHLNGWERGRGFKVKNERVI